MAVTVTVAAVLQAIRDQHPRFSRQSTGDAPVVRALDRYQRTLMARIADIKRDAVSVTVAVELPLATHADGGTIPEHILVHGGVAVFTDTNRDPEPIDLVAYAYRDNRSSFQWPVYIQDNTLFPVGRATDWDQVDRIDIEYFPATTAVATKAGTYAMPKDALDVLAAYGAKFMEMRLAVDENRPANPLILQAAADAELFYINQVTGRKRARGAVGKVIW